MQIRLFYWMSLCRIRHIHEALKSRIYVFITTLLTLPTFMAAVRDKIATVFYFFRGSFCSQYYMPGWFIYQMKEHYLFGIVQDCVFFMGHFTLDGGGGSSFEFFMHGKDTNNSSLTDRIASAAAGV